MTSREWCPQQRSKLHWTWKCLFSESDNDAWWQSVRYFVDWSPDKALRLAGDTQTTRGSRGSRTNTCLEGFPCNKKQTLGATKQINCCLSVSCEQDALAQDPSALFDLDPCCRHCAALAKVIYQTQHCRGSGGERGRPGMYANKHREETLPSAVKGLKCMFLFASGRKHKLNN